MPALWAAIVAPFEFSGLWAARLGCLTSGPSIASVMALPHRPEDCRDRDPSDRDPRCWSVQRQQLHLQRCWQGECDIDPMILRARQLRHQGSLPQAAWVEEELLPLF